MKKRPFIEAREGGAIISSKDALRHFGIGKNNFIMRDKPLGVKSRIDGKKYYIHSQGYGAFRIYPNNKKDEKSRHNKCLAD